MFAPLNHRMFAAIWAASIFSSIGSQLQQVGAAWLMTSLDPSPETVALVTAASTLPILLFSLLSGALSDAIDRRLVLIGAQFLMFAASATLAISDYMGIVTPALLLVLTFLVGSGAAIMAPAWQSAVGELVPRSDVPAAVGLNVMAFNIARTVGPAAGGVIVAVAGSKMNFAINAVSYLALIAVLLRWHPAQKPALLPPEAVLPAMRDGIRYAFHSQPVRFVLVRAMCFGFCSSIVVSLMALVSHDLLGKGAAIFGVLMGCMGLGAVTGAMSMTPLRRKLSNEGLVRLSIAITSCALLGIGLSRWLPLTCAALLTVGFGMVLGLSTFNVSIQMSVPRWVSGRALAIYQMFTFGGMTVGAWCWGRLGEEIGIGAVYMTSAAVLITTLLLAIPMPLREVDEAEVTSAPLDRQEDCPHDEASCTLLTIEYRVSAPRTSDFARAVEERQRLRLRDGALEVAVMQSPLNPHVWEERILFRNWTEYRRQMGRRTLQAKLLDDVLIDCHSGDCPPVYRFLPATKG